MLLVTFCLVISLPLACNQVFIDGPEDCNSICGFGAHIRMGASLRVKGKEIQIPKDASVSLECDISAPDVQKIKIIWALPLSSTLLPPTEDHPDASSTQMVFTSTDVAPRLSMPSATTETLSTVTEFPVTVISTLNSDNSVTSEFPSTIVTADMGPTPETVSIEIESPSTSTDTILVSASTFTPESIDKAEKSTFSSDYSSVASTVSKAGTESTSSTSQTHSSESTTDFSATSKVLDSETYSTTPLDPFTASAAKTNIEEGYESSGNAESSADAIDSIDKSLLEFLSTSSDEILLLTPNYHLERIRRRVLGKRRRLTETPTDNIIELWFKNGSTSHFLNKIKITLQIEVTGDSKTTFIVQYGDKRMEAPHDYKYECSSEVFIVDDSVVLLLQNVAVVVFRAGNDCTLEKSKHCGDTNEENNNNPYRGVIIAGILIGAFSFAGIVWIKFRKWFRMCFSEQSRAVL